MTGPQCKARMTCYFALLQWPTQTLYSGSKLTVTSTSSPRHGIEPWDMSFYPLHRRTEQTEEQEKHYNCVHLCTACISVWLYFSNESWLSKQHNSILCKMNLLLHDLIWARKTAKVSDHCRTVTSTKTKKEILLQVKWTVLLLLHMLCFHALTVAPVLCPPPVRDTASLVCQLWHRQCRQGGGRWCPFYTQLSAARGHLFSL